MIVLDVSFDHARATPANIKRAGAAGVILYAGCDDTRKNTTAGEVAALLDAGLMVGLVVENGARDLAKGTGEGARQGKALAAAARTLGYDLARCVGFAAADFDETADATAALAGGMRGFGGYVPHPGIYGDRDSIDAMFARGLAVAGWQSASASFSNGTSPHANLGQRVGGLPGGYLTADINTVLSEPIGLMGEIMQVDSLTPAAIKQIVDAMWAQEAPYGNGKSYPMWRHVTGGEYWAERAARAATAARANAATLTQIKTMIASAQSGHADATAVVAELAKVLAAGEATGPSGE